ncbi:MAG: hypothetical protein LQ337_002622 [Flavoplaca oasis]|nr:MAG: hypothetical protein LQ337_002622 [Flavoplaca oasis]
MPSDIQKDGSMAFQTTQRPSQDVQIQGATLVKEEQPEHTTALPPPPSAPYTIFTSSHRRLMVLILILTMLASPLTATIYLPLLPLLATHFHVSLQAINLTLTLYIVFQAISPLLFATASDSFGRRPIYLITFSVYTLASLGLVLNRSSYAGLLVLRALQSLGSSAVLAIGYGVIADLCVPSERGAMQGPAMGAANLAVCIGPVVGGWVALGSGSYEWVFWCLVIYGGSVLVVVGFGLPETARNVVGNGERKAPWWGRTWWSLVMLWRRNRRPSWDGSEGHLDEEKTAQSERSKEQSSRMKQSFKMPNPWTAIRIIFWKDTALVLWMAGSPYAIWYCVQASIPPIYKDVYGFNDFQVGLAYLPGGFGTVIGGYANGKLMDWNYKVTARQIGHTVDKVFGDDLNHFPIEKARARGSWYMLGVYLCALGGYGWAINFYTHVSIPLILQFVLAALCTAFQQTFNALLVDIFPASPSTAAASGNITRCALSAVAVAILQPMVDGMGRGWYFTLLSLVSGGGAIIANWLITTRGITWRHQRLQINNIN